MLFCTVLFIIASLAGCGGNPFDDIPDPTNGNCTKCYISFPPITPFSPVYLMPLIEIRDQSGKMIGSRYYFNSWEPSRVEITCGKKVQIDVFFWEVCSAFPGQPIYARLWQGRGFVSPTSCDESVNLNNFEWIVGNCIRYLFQ